MNPTLEHDGLIYRSDDEYASALVPFLREGIAAGEGTVVATNERNRDLLAHALGSDADAVLFVPSQDVYRSPHAAVAAYHGVLDLLLSRGHPSVRAVGEVSYPSSEGAREAWLRYEPIAHEMFADAPLHVICPYDARELPARLIQHAEHTHPHLRMGRGCAASRDFTDPREVLAVIPDAFSYRTPGEPDLALDVDPRGVASARSAIGAAIERFIDPQGTRDAVVAVNELLTNGIRYGTGPVGVDVWGLAEVVVCRVHNEGPRLDDPFAGYRLARNPQTGGMGLWLARQIAHEMHIGFDDLGPVVSLAFLR